VPKKTYFPGIGNSADKNKWEETNGRKIGLVKSISFLPLFPTTTKKKKKKKKNAKKRAAEV
jgi:hypothetical protein